MKNMNYTSYTYKETCNNAGASAPSMTKKELEQLYNEVVQHEKKVLFAKNDEYSNNTTALSNFYDIANIQQTTRYRALWNLMSKHLYSVIKLINTQGEGASRELIREKICDCRNYLLLLEALLTEHMPAKEEV